MSIIVRLKNPELFLKNFTQNVQKHSNHIWKWEFEQHYFTYIAFEESKEVAKFIPDVKETEVRFQYQPINKEGHNYENFAVYHGRFIEILLKNNLERLIIDISVCSL